MANFPALLTVENYVERARVILLDQVAPFRYRESELVESLNEAIMEARKLRPDLFIKYLRGELQSFDSSVACNPTVVDIDPQYRQAFVYYIVGHAQLRDDENSQDARASAMLNKFVAQLMTAAA